MQAGTAWLPAFLPACLPTWVPACLPACISEECEVGQGYLYGKPMPCDEFESILLQRSDTPNAHASGL